MSDRKLFVFKNAGWVCSHLPHRAVDALCDLSATAVMGVSHVPIVGSTPRRWKTMLLRHMRRAQPDASSADLSRASRDAVASYMRYWIELLAMPHFSQQDIAKRCTQEGFEHIASALEAKKGAVIAIPHLGGWEFGGAWLSSRIGRVVAVAEKLEPPELYEWFVDQRSRLGIDIVPLDSKAGAAMLECLHAGRVVALPCDRDLPGNGVVVDFFGETTTLPAGPVTLAMRSGAPLLPAAIYYQPGGKHHVVIRPELQLDRSGRFRQDVARHTQRLANELESLVRNKPSDWHLLSPNWPSDFELLGIERPPVNSSHLPSESTHSAD